MIKIAFRDDDVDSPIEQFFDYHKLMQEFDMPVAYAVIPGRVTIENAKTLRELKKNAKMDFLQHGWMHTNHGKEKKAEFGVRERGIECVELARGFERMKTLFAEDFLPVFVPPYHSYTLDNCRDAFEIGCKGWSAKNSMPLIHGIKDLNAHVFFDTYTDNGHSFAKASEIKRQFLLLSKHTPRVIFLTHHKKILEEEAAELRNVLEFLTALKKKRMVTFCSFSELMEE